MGGGGWVARVMAAAGWERAAVERENARRGGGVQGAGGMQCVQEGCRGGAMRAGGCSACRRDAGCRGDAMRAGGLQ